MKNQETDHNYKGKTGEIAARVKLSDFVTKLVVRFGRTAQTWPVALFQRQHKIKCALNWP